MRTLKGLIIAIAASTVLLLAGTSTHIAAQDVSMKSIGKSVVKGSKKTYKTSRRVGTTIGNRTWTGSKWVASKSWKGGKWVLVKTKNGSKWVYRKGRNFVVGKPARKP